MDLSQVTTIDTHSPRFNMHHHEPYRLALIGCGPRGLYCLDSLSRALRKVSADTMSPQSLEIVIYEPSPHPGAGNVYAVDQPHMLRMNFASQRIDAWIDDEDRTPDQLTLVDWLAIHHPEHAAPEGYAPRSIVGEYLHDCYQHTLRAVSQFATVTLHQKRIEDVERIGNMWRIESADDSTKVDEIVLTVGHEGWRTRPSQRERKHHPHQEHIDSVFPVQKQLTTERVPPGCSVAIRGFGLTWIDAALSLTEGRGGRFEPSGKGFVYCVSGNEPRVIYPFSRTGRPMLAKPIQSLVKVSKTVDEIWEAGRVSLGHTPRPVDKSRFHELIWQPILNTAQRALDETGVKASVCEWWNDWRSDRFTAQRAFHEIRQSIAVAYGDHQPTAAWALAEAWRNLYSVLVKVVSHGGLDENAWAEFRPLAAEMERIAYGPPAENLARIVALVDAGIVDLSFVANPDETVLDQTDVDVIINAVLPAPTDPAPTGPLTKLLEGGQLRRLNRFTGIDINRTGRPRSQVDETRDDIAIFGRITEGCVLGNDTLSRRLHSHIEDWAAEVAAKVIPNS